MHRRIGCSARPGQPMQVQSLVLQHENAVCRRPSGSGDAIHLRQRDRSPTCDRNLVEQIAGEESDPRTVGREEWVVRPFRSRQNHRGISRDRTHSEHRGAVVRRHVDEVFAFGRDGDRRLPPQCGGRAREGNGGIGSEQEIQNVDQRPGRSGWRVSRSGNPSGLRRLRRPPVRLVASACAVVAVARMCARTLAPSQSLRRM